MAAAIAVARDTIGPALEANSGELVAVVNALPQLLQLATAISDQFATVTDWREAEVGRAVEALARVKAALSVDPDAAAHLLRDINGRIVARTSPPATGVAAAA